MQAILRASCERGMHLVDGLLLDAFGPKILMSSTPLYELSVEDDALRIALMPISGVLPPSTNLKKKRLPKNCRRAFSAIICGISTTWLFLVRRQPPAAAPTVSRTDTRFCPSWQRKIAGRFLSIVAIQNEEFCAESARSLDSVVIEVLLFFIHEGRQSKVRAQELAKKVSLIYEGRGSQHTVSAENVGWAIKRLRIPSGRIDRAGNGVELTAEVGRQVHRLALAYGVQAIQSGVHQNCRFCEEFRIG